MKTVIITGASSGIGLALVKLFESEEETNVFAVSRHIDGLTELKTSTNANFKILPYDITKFRSIIAKEVSKNGHKIDYLINNAGVLINESFEKSTEEMMDRMFDVNFKAPYFLIQELLPHFNKPAHIVNIGSMGGYQGSSKFPGLSIYSASKAALANMTECLAEELKDKQINVNCLALGAVDTPMLEKAFPTYKANMSAEKMAEFIHDFTINGSKYMNGKIVPVSISTP